ncbi:hypothetical protein [Enterococcus sp.]|uniref:hypothetical protein n=1 Tax=Enterococcus sp. TaxID=35783 RepID=UPI003C712B8B
MKEETKCNKRFLNRYRRYMKRVDKLEEKLYQIDVQLQGIKSRRITDMPRGGTPLSVDDLLVMKEETEHRIQNLMNRSKGIRLEVFDCIDTLEDDRFAEVLELYFIERLTFEQIAERKCFSIRHVGYLYGMGIDSVMIPSGKA